MERVLFDVTVSSKDREVSPQDTAPADKDVACLLEVQGKEASHPGTTLLVPDNETIILLQRCIIQGRAQVEVEEVQGEGEDEASAQGPPQRFGPQEVLLDHTLEVLSGNLYLNECHHSVSVKIHHRPSMIV